MLRSASWLLLALAGPIGGCTAGGSVEPEGRSPFVAVIERNAPAVVAVTGPQGNLGTGFLVDAEGHVLTAAHVVRAAADTPQVRSGERDYAAAILAIDAEQDLALLSVVDLRNQRSVEFDDALVVGDWIVVLGNPFGTGITAAAGIVGGAPGALQRPAALQGLIQLDAAINPGNSGGPVLNPAGRVIGMATAAIPGGAGIGFAMPTTRLKDFLENAGRRTAPAPAPVNRR